MKKFYLSLALLTGVSFTSFSQIKVDENKVAQFAQEVYQNCAQYTTAQYLDIYKNTIRRITIITSKDVQDDKKIVKISTLSLRDKCNPALKYDTAANFTPAGFNPLKYFFPQNNSPLFYQIEGTDYIIQVNPSLQ